MIKLTMHFSMFAFAMSMLCVSAATYQRATSDQIWALDPLSTKLEILSSLHTKESAAMLIKHLQQKENRLNSLKCQWQVISQEQAPKMSSAEVEKQQNAIRNQVPDQLRKQGAREDLIQAIVEQEVRQTAEAGRGLVYFTNQSFDITRVNNETLIVGKTEGSADQRSFVQYYKGSDGLLIILPGSYQGMPQHLTEPPLIWGASGDTIRCREPFQTGCNLHPEYFAFLSNLNPLAIYNANWTLTSTTPRTYTLETQVKENPDMDNSIIEIIHLTLSRRLNDAPAYVNVKRVLENSVIESHTIQVLGYERRGTDWICNKFLATNTFQNGSIKIQKFDLRTVSSIHSLPILPITHEIVNDYRLVGPNMSSDDYLLSLSDPKSKMVSYQWSGYFPKLEELRQLKK